MSKGLIAQDKPVPAPDMSFVRLFNDNSLGWQQRGQYAIWTGASSADARHLLLERAGSRVAPITHKDGRPVFHKVAANVSFTIENYLGVWVAFDSDAMWVDTPAPEGRRYAVLVVGGAAGKPGRATIDLTCPSCGSAVHPRSLEIGPNGFNAFLRAAGSIAAELNQTAQLRTCSHCNTVHPPLVTMLNVNGNPMPQAARN